jgi:hypothetical protein
MVARHKNKIDFGDASHPLGTYGFNPAQPGACGQSFILLAVNFTGQTPDAFRTIVEEIKFTHGLLLVSSRIIGFKKPVSL